LPQLPLIAAPRWKGVDATSYCRNFAFLTATPPPALKDALTVYDIQMGSLEPERSGLRILNLLPEDPRWVDFLKDHPDALLYHHPAWFELLRETFGYKAAALGCVDGTGRLSGILPLLRQRSYFADVHFSSLPRTPVTGPLATDDDSLRTLLSAAASLVDNSRTHRVQLNVMGPRLDGLIHGFNCVRQRNTYVLDLPSSPEHLRFGSSRNNSRIRWAVRKSSRSGVSLREASSLDDLRRWYQLYLGTMRAHVTPPQPFRLFRLMWESLAPRHLFRLLLAERNAGGQTSLLAGSIFLIYGHTVLYAYNGRDHSQLEFRPNDAIQYRAITEACAAGFRRYDFGPVSMHNDGLADFKEKWSAKPVELYSYGYPWQPESERMLLGSSSLRSAAEWAWHRLPLPVTSAAGTFIDKFL
jgi:CelD/BcsL family acetyltransferase involved in cellulose biosynthesis